MEHLMPLGSETIAKYKVESAKFEGEIWVGGGGGFRGTPTPSVWNTNDNPAMLSMPYHYTCKVWIKPNTNHIPVHVHVHMYLTSRLHFTLLLADWMRSILWWSFLSWWWLPLALVKISTPSSPMEMWGLWEREGGRERERERERDGETGEREREREREREEGGRGRQEREREVVSIKKN